MQLNEEKGNDVSWQKKSENGIACWLPEEQMKTLCCFSLNVKSEGMVQSSKHKRN